MKSVLKWGIWLYIAAACAYIFYEWYAYAGLFRLAAEWQLEHYGSYRMRLTLLFPLMVLLTPAAVLVTLSGMQDQLRGADADAGSAATFALLARRLPAPAPGARGKSQSSRSRPPPARATVPTVIASGIGAKAQNPA